MGRTKLDIAEKARILALVNEGLSNRDIAMRSGRSMQAIRMLKKAAAGLPPNAIPKRKEGSGRPRKTSMRTDSMLKREVMSCPTVTAGELKANHPDVLAGVSTRTIQHRLQKHMKMPCRKAAKKPLITARMRKQRLDFCSKYKNWTVEQWRHVMWSDESTFRCIRSTAARVRRPIGTSRYDPKYTQKTVKHPDGVMVWGCFSGQKGRGGLYFLPKNVTMNGVRYVDVLESHLKNAYYIHECTHFMQDSAPCHKAKSVSTWLKKEKIEVLQWPGNSPDLNPIENAWNQMKRKLSCKNTSSVPHLCEEIKKLWVLDMHLDYFQKLSDSMPTRIQKVIQAKGNVTKY